MSWQQKIHVKGTMPYKKGRYSLFIGRWQPLHEGHKELFNQILDAGGNVCIAIREMDVDEKNPYTALEVLNNLTEHYYDLIKKKRVKIIVVPDINSVDFGRGVGYDIVEHIPPTEIAEISATKIREEMKNSENNGQKTLS
jgi:nicotinamide mononucleotide adenylyltransferase